MKKLAVILLGVLFFSNFFILDLVSFLFKASNVKSPETLTVTNIFIFVILSLFWIGLVQLFAKWKKVAKFAGSIPSHLTALGILGTFVGIFVGLYKFNPANISESVPLLLEGMKLAFSTSIAGLASSTILRVSHSISISISDSPDDPFGEGQNLTLVNPSDSMFEIMNMKNQEFDQYISRLEKLKSTFEKLFSGLDESGLDDFLRRNSGDK